MPSILQERLSAFAKNSGFSGKGPLSVGLVVTDLARRQGLPLDPASLLTDKEGQVSGLNRATVQAVLARHGITKILSSEAGRTSRGSISKMRDYVAFLNDAASDLEGFSLRAVEEFWVARVQEFFAAKPFRLKLDASLSLRAVIRNVITEAETRQRAMQGTMIVGTVMQHMVGAKLDLILGPGVVRHHGSNQNDAGTDRAGDFEVGDVAIHVTASAGEALIAKCRDNLDRNLKPMIVTGRGRVSTAEGLADNAGIAARIEVVDFEQFLSTNLHEMSRFTSDGRRVKIGDLVDRYNEIIDANETDPSLRIEVT